MSVNQPEELNNPEEFFPEHESDFEQQLARALHHVDPPKGFADRTLAHLQPSAPARLRVVTMTPRPRRWASGALAATLVVAAILTQQTHARHQRQQAEIAQQQFDAAMRITDNTLEHVRQQLQRAGVQIGN
jgi:2-polyprenyl-3-methyl-5-hydroxy-6-metoxy-1,4-benzoquinol methylase